MDSTYVSLSPGNHAEDGVIDKKKMVILRQWNIVKITTHGENLGPLIPHSFLLFQQGHTLLPESLRRSNWSFLIFFNTTQKQI